MLRDAGDDVHLVEPSLPQQNGGVIWHELPVDAWHHHLRTVAQVLKEKGDALIITVVLLTRRFLYIFKSTINVCQRLTEVDDYTCRPL